MGIRLLNFKELTIHNFINMVRGQGVAKDKNGASAAIEGTSSGGCGNKCACGTKQRLAQKQAINQRMAERNLANAKSTNPTPVDNRSTNNSNKKNSAPPLKSVDKLVNYIEGNSNSSDKKKLKKERQKQERIKALKEQEEKERKLQEAIAREQERVKEEERRKAEAEKEMAQMSKKQLKKANQRAKKLAEEQGTTHVPLPKPTNQTPVPGAFGKTAALPSTMSQPNLSLDQLKAKHQRELEMMELKHKQALEEEYVRSMYKQSGQHSNYSQYQPSRYQQQATPAFGGLGSSLGSLGSSSGGLGSSFGGLGSSLGGGLGSSLTGGLGSSLGGGLGSSLGNLGSTRSPSSPLSSLEDLKAQLNNLTTNTMNQLRSGLMKSSLTGSTNNNEMPGLQFNSPSNDALQSGTNQQNSKSKKKKAGNTSSIAKKEVSNGVQPTNSNLPKGAQEALAKAGKNPENQIKISRNSQGGVDFTPVPTKAKL